MRLLLTCTNNMNKGYYETIMDFTGHGDKKRKKIHKYVNSVLDALE